MNETSTQVANPRCTRRSLLRLAAAGAGVVTIGPPLDACDRPGTPSLTVKYLSYTSEADRAPEDKWFALFTRAVPGGRVERLFVPPDQMTAKVIGAGASRSGPDVFEQSGDLDQLVPAGVV